MEARTTGLVAIGGSSGPVSAAASERPPTNDNVNDTDKSDNDGGFFDCNICFDLASDPVVTCCGHLFCWACLYRWVNDHTKECPICKGEVTLKTITPIYSRRNRITDVGSRVGIPLRPEANRIESWRQLIQRNAFYGPIFETIRRLNSRFELTRDVIPENPQEIPLLDRIFTSRGMRVGLNTVAEGSGQTGPTGSTHGSNRISGLGSEDQEQLALMEDRHSFSSIAAIIQSESQMEIDSHTRRLQ